MKRGVTLTEIVVSMALIGLLLLVSTRATASALRTLRSNDDRMSAWDAIERLMVHWHHGQSRTWKHGRWGTVPGSTQMVWVCGSRREQLVDANDRSLMHVERMRVAIVDVDGLSAPERVSVLSGLADWLSMPAAKTGSEPSVDEGIPILASLELLEPAD